MILQWIVIVIFVFVALLFFKAEHSSREVKIFIIILLGLILYLSIVSLFASNKVDLGSPRGVVNAVYIYFGWVGQTATNLWDIGVDTAGMVGNAVKMNNSEDGRR